MQTAAGEHDTVVLRRMAWTPGDPTEVLVTREWLVTNGLGGYASGTVSGVPTRRHHGYLIAALPSPLGRTVMLQCLYERVRWSSGETVHLFGGEEHLGDPLVLEGAPWLAEFRLENGLPCWRFAFKGFLLERRVFLPHRQNTVCLVYRLIDGPEPVQLELRPTLHCRPHNAAVDFDAGEDPQLVIEHDRYEFRRASFPFPLRMILHGRNKAFTSAPKSIPGVFFRVEDRRGYESTSDLRSPGYFITELVAGEQSALIASTESWETILALSPYEALEHERERRRKLIAAAPIEASRGIGPELVLAADQFIVTPAGRSDSVRAVAAGEEARSVIAGYHWFTDWGRDTMISLEGLTISTGRATEAGYILRTFAHAIQDGLIPNLYPEGGDQGLYHTADATLWYFHAISRYLEATGDRGTLRLLLPKLADIVDHYVHGTRFGIGVDPADGLVHQGAEGYQLTWMDAKVGDWVVTPRRGKAVEINALWYNALCLMARWMEEESGAEAASPYRERAAAMRHAFNERFWCERRNHLFDVIDGEGGDDDACRPNQLLAISLEHPVLAAVRWEAVLETVEERLLTPVGLRSLDPHHPLYKRSYDGDLRSRDAAYHQGTVWAWLIGPYIDACLKVHPDDRERARRALDGLAAHLGEACIGSVSEIFDAESPYAPRGCAAQAWSVAELLRTFILTAPKED